MNPFRESPCLKISQIFSTSDIDIFIADIQRSDIKKVESLIALPNGVKVLNYLEASLIGYGFIFY